MHHPARGLVLRSHQHHHEPRGRQRRAQLVDQQGGHDGGGGKAGARQATPKLQVAPPVCQGGLARCGPGRAHRPAGSGAGWGRFCLYGRIGGNVGRGLRLGLGVQRGFNARPQLGGRYFGWRQLGQRQQAGFPALHGFAQGRLQRLSRLHLTPLLGVQGAQHVLSGQLVQRVGGVEDVGGRRAHAMHSRSDSRLRRIQAFTVPSGAPRRVAISPCEQPST